MSDEEQKQPEPTSPEPDAKPQGETPASEPGITIALIGELQACRGAARVLARKKARVRVLCADETESTRLLADLKSGPDALTSDELACVSVIMGQPESDSDLGRVLDGVSGAALLSPVGPEGRTWRAASHLDDVRSFLECVSNRRIARLVYLSSLGAGTKRPIRCLKEADEAERLVSECGCTDFLLRTGPVIGRGDPWLTRVFRKAASGCPFAVVRGYGDTLFQPIHEDDLGACIARCFLAPAGDLHPGAYSLASTPPANLMNLLERAAKYLGRCPKIRLHVPLFVLGLNVRFKRLVNRDRAWEYGDPVGLLRCGLVAEKNDLESLMGPACSTRPLANALDEAAAALGLTPAAQTS